MGPRRSKKIVGREKSLHKMKSRVIFVDKKIKKAFEKLKNSTGEKKILYRWLNRAFDDLAENATVGIQIPNRLIPREYKRKYGIDNLWKYNLPNAWRLIYSIKREEIIILSIILEWFDHKSYERKFRY